MNIRQLECFVEVANTLNFTQASRNLYISQTAVTNHIKHLENQIGFRLFERDKKNVRLTSNGKIFLLSAKNLLDSDALCKQTILKLNKGISGELNIGYLRGLELCLMTNILNDYYQNHQETSINLFRGHKDELYELLTKNKVDCIFSSLIESNPKPYIEINHEYCGFLIHSYGLVAAINEKNPLSQRDSINYVNLKNNIILDIDSSNNDGIAKNLDNTLLKISINSCAAVLADFIAEYYTNHNKFIKFLPIKDINTKFNIYIIYNKNNSNITFNHFLETTLEHKNHACI